MSGFSNKIKVFYDAIQGGRNYMEDVVSVKFRTVEDGSASDRSLAFFGVFDGHGGSEAAYFAEKHLLSEIMRQDGFWSDDDNLVTQAIKDGFISTHHLMSKTVGSWPQTVTGLPSTAGTTASIAILRSDKLYVAHVGDSAIVIGEQTSNTCDDKFIAHYVTEDHKPESCKERARIEHCGGEILVKAGVSRVVWKRPRLVKGLRRRSVVTDSIPFLAVARSLGDLWSYNSERDVYIVSPEPDVSIIELNREKHRCLIVASDGVWNMLSADEAVGYIWRWNQHQQASRLKSCDTLLGSSVMEQPAAGLVHLALDRWLVRGIRADNISAIVVLFQEPDGDAKPSPTVLELGTKSMAQSYRSSAFRAVSSVYRQARSRAGRFSRPMLLRAALHQLWRIRARSGATSRPAVSSHGVHSVLLPLGTVDHLQAPVPLDMDISQQLLTVDSSVDIFACKNRVGTSPAKAKGARARQSYEVACSDDDEGTISQPSPKRLCFKDDNNIDDSTDDTKCSEKTVFTADVDHLSPLVGKSSINKTLCGDCKKSDTNVPCTVQSDTLQESSKVNSGRSCNSRLCDWSRQSHPTCLMRTRLQLHRVYNG